MYNNDYIIAVDENGQPYIAHAYATDDKGRNTRQGVRNAISGFRSRAHQYLQKVKTKTGNWRYLYTPEEVAALGKRAAKKAWASKAGRWIDEHDAGISESIMAKRLDRKARRANRKGGGYHDDAAAYARRARELRDEARGERQRAKDYIGIGGKKRVEEASAATKAAKTQMNKSYAAEQRTKIQSDNLREMARKASGEKFNKINGRYASANSAHRKAQAQYEADTQAYRDAVREGHKANQTYNDSLIGKIERKVRLGKNLTKEEAKQFAAFLARVRGGND